MRSNLPGNQECPLIKDLESSENPFIILLMMTCCRDNLDLVGIAVPGGLQCAVQQNASLLINLDRLEEREDISTVMTMASGCKMHVKQSTSPPLRLPMIMSLVDQGFTRGHHCTET